MLISERDKMLKSCTVPFVCADSLVTLIIPLLESESVYPGITTLLLNMPNHLKIVALSSINTTAPPATKKPAQNAMSPKGDTHDHVCGEALITANATQPITDSAVATYR